MPASSRKRNKGKERKTKKAENERLKMHESWLDDLAGGHISCDHELVSEINITTISHDHPVAKFMITFYTYWIEGLLTPAEILKHTMQTHPQVCNNDIHRETIISIMIRIGTNMLLFNHEGSLCLAQSIAILENYECVDSSIAVYLLYYAALYNRETAKQRSKLWIGAGSGRRDYLKFFRKRTSCKCLKKMHLEARKQLSKMGKCMNCNDIRERTSLSVCSRCMITQYCSRECQVAAWSEHKGQCDRYVWANG